MLTKPWKKKMISTHHLTRIFVLSYFVLLCSFCIYVHGSKVFKPVSSSSSIHWRKKILTLAADDEPSSEEIDRLYESQAHEFNNVLPQDLLALKDENYLKYLKNRSYPTDQFDFSHISIKPDTYGPLMKCKYLKNWLNLCDVDENYVDVLKIIESPHFDGLSLKYLNNLPLIYLEERAFAPFAAFLQRFRYRSEIDRFINLSCSDTNLRNKMYLVPLTFLVLLFTTERNINDPSLEHYFVILLKTQPAAIIPTEFYLLEHWLTEGPDAWKFLRLYFEFIESDTKCENLVKIIIGSYSNSLTSDFCNFLMSLPNFDLNVKIDYHYIFDCPKTSFFHILIMEKKYLTNLLPLFLNDPRLDVTMPTGNIYMKLMDTEIVYTDCPILFLAISPGYFLTFIQLISNHRIIKSENYLKLIKFILLHIFTIVFLNFKLVSDDFSEFYNLNANYSYN